MDVERAACRDVDPETFFPDPSDRHGVAAARAICKGCPVAAECLEESLALDARYGIWGGLTPHERGFRDERGYSGRGRPITAACPSYGAYHRHLQRGEPTCQQCREFVNAANHARQAKRLRDAQ